MTDRILKTESLRIGYEKRHPVLQDLDLEMLQGKVVTLIGPNGAGKSTLLKTLAGQLQPLGGTVYLNGKPLQGQRELETAELMAVLLTERVRPELMTAEELVGLGRYPYTGRLGILSKKDRDEVEKAMILTQTWDLKGSLFRELSDGQQQRVMLARAVCQNPKVLLLDEPTSYLDIHHKIELLSILRKLAKTDHVAVVMTLHELDLAQKVSDRLICVRDGRVDRTGTPEEIFSDGYPAQLFGLSRGAYLENYGALELERVSGPPQIFVIGGGGSGIGLYRRLNRMGIPFAAGILQENDLDYPVAEALAQQIVSEPAFEPAGKEAADLCRRLIDGCSAAVCTLQRFGPLNQENYSLMCYAKDCGKLRSEKDFSKEADDPAFGLSFPMEKE